MADEMRLLAKVAEQAEVVKLKLNELVASIKPEIADLRLKELIASINEYLALAK